MCKNSHLYVLYLFTTQLISISAISDSLLNTSTLCLVTALTSMSLSSYSQQSPLCLVTALSSRLHITANDSEQQLLVVSRCVRFHHLIKSLLILLKKSAFDLHKINLQMKKNHHMLINKEHTTLYLKGRYTFGNYSKQILSQKLTW